MKRLWDSLSGNRGYFVLTLLVGILYCAGSVLTPMASGRMISAFTQSLSLGCRFLILYVLISLCQTILYLLDSSFGKHFRLRQKRMMREKCFRAFSRKDSAGREETASFVSFVNNDIPALTEQYYTGTIDIVKCVCLLVFSAASLLSIHWALALIVFGVSCAIVLSPKAMKKKGAAAREEYSEALGRYNVSLQSFLGGLRVIRCYGYYKRANQLQETANAKTAAKERRLARCQVTVEGITGFLQSVRTLLFLSVGAVLIATGKIRIGDVVAAMQISELIAAPAEVLAYMIHARNEVEPLLGRYEQMTGNVPAEDGVETALSDSIEAICVKNVSYAAGGLPILRDVTATFEKGKNYLITGESGSGKSTLMRLMAQVGDLDYTGEIVCNGTEERQLASDSLYQRECAAFQEPYLFYDTLEENIRLGREIPEMLYTEVIKKLNLGYLLERYRDREITPEIMEQLSGGERQRIALARAMVRQPEAYLLDEATSALDAGNAEAIEEMLLREDAMVIHICHKPNSRLLPLYHQHLTMDKGRLTVAV